ncbi:MAG: AMP-binding protein, partial [bacterium]|nr:AMP-binding protein [bacterium]
KPKGVLISHRAVNNFILGVCGRIEFSPAKTLLSATTFSFDIFVLETLLPLTRGVKIIFPGSRRQKIPRLLLELILRHDVKMLQSTPTLMSALLESEEETGGFKNLTDIMVGGEAVPWALLENLREKAGSKTRIFNMYGPTETTVWSTIRELTRDTEITIGTPIANTQIYIIGTDNTIQPIGVHGELCIAGDGMARGYLNRPELSDEKFLKNPLMPSFPNNQSPITNTYLYRTGDLAKWLPDGNIECLGRIDHQVKIRGFRIELEEIENRLLENENIKETVVVARKDKESNNYLAAYYIPDDTGTAEDTDRDAPTPLGKILRDHLAAKLPDYMIPSYFVPIEKLPLTPNGKIDRKALPEPGESGRILSQYQAPTTETEEKLVLIWQEVLKLERVGVTDNFFEIGGHSLKAINVISKIGKIFQVDLPLTTLFKKPYIKELAHYITGSSTTQFSAIETVEKKDHYPLSAAQKRLYALNRFVPGSVNYNMPGILFIDGELSSTRFEEAFQKLIHRHESLRTSFHFIDGEPLQRIHKAGEIEFSVAFSEINAKTDEGAPDALFTRFLRPFILTRAPLLRVEVVKQEENR